MEKDVIYIDTDDDITSIIGKIKASKERIVAIVPPKRTGILQSAVNLRLLSRMAETANKKIVIVTNNKPLIALSAAAMIPVAKNLQSKPVLAEVEDIESEDIEDIIDGSQLPVGELAKTADNKPDDTVDEVVETIDIEEFESPKKKKDEPKVKNTVKIPDFKSFRNKLFIILILGSGLTAFIVWALVYAPFARIIVTTRTSSAPVSQTVMLGGTQPTNVSKNIIQTITKQSTRDLSVEFTATGSRDEGAKAFGNITLSYSTMQSDEITKKTGRQITFDGKVYNIQDDIVISGTEGGYGEGSGQITAAESGESYNIPAGSECTLVNDPQVYCITNDGIAGGTTKIVSFVTATDIQTAKEALVKLPTTTDKSDLTKKFTNGEKVIGDSFTVDRAEAVSVPAVGETVTGKAKLTSATTFSITAISKSELQTFLKDSVSKQIVNPKTQRLYDDGINNVVLSDYNKTNQGATVNITATGKIGPNINEAYIIELSKGKKFGDIQTTLESVEGISSVDVKFSYIWVATVPNDTKKIQVEFRFEDVKK